MDIDQLRRKIVEDFAECARLHARIHETFRYREESDERRQEWLLACSEFNARFDLLSFPGSYSTAWERIAAGDADAIEAALLFLEIRPYFFHSGYMFKDLLRKVKRATLSASQAQRLYAVREKLSAWKASRGRPDDFLSNMPDARKL